MKARELFSIILKIFGIYLVKDVFVALSSALSTFLQFLNYSLEVALFTLIGSIIFLAVEVLIVYFLLFRTEWLVAKLKLEKEFSEEPLQISMHRSQVFTIAVVCAGLVILAVSIPNFVKQFYAWYSHIDSGRMAGGDGAFAYGGLLSALAEVFIGLLFLGNQRLIVNYVESRNRKKDRDIV